MNAKETLKELRAMLGFSEEETKVEMATATLTDGTIIEWEGELAVGTAVFVQTAEGNIPAPDATHEVEGGMLVTTEGGFVTEIVEPEVEAEEFATVSAFNDVVSKLESAIAELSAKVESLTASNVKHKEAMSKAIDLIEKVADLPSEEPLKAPVSTKKNDRFEALKRIKNSINK